ncbi:MAG: hypothetical protein WBC70_13835 [Candidatus Aminicenantales bacterium]
MDEKKIIAVVGATGSQGGGVCRAVLTDAGGSFYWENLIHFGKGPKRGEGRRVG